MKEIDKLKEKSISYFCEKPSNFPEGKPFNCCETIIKTLAEQLGIESDLIPRIGTGIGAGVSRNGLLCGCISGPALLIGIKTGRNTTEENPMKTWELVDDYLKAFKKRYKYTNCRQLTGVDVKTPEGMKKYFESIHDYSCAERVKFAVEKTLEILGEK
ncbi:MAG: C-GCAxxG-C-C family protein [Thermoplasmatota archaeon]|jgi:C_GCAxxG_C_C family probable redox protein